MNCLEDLKDFYAFYDFYGFNDLPLTIDCEIGTDCQRRIDGAEIK